MLGAPTRTGGPPAPRRETARDSATALGRARTATPPGQLDLVFRTQRGSPVNPNHASRAFTRLAAIVGLDVWVP
jgi:hypothetical protein